jgi:HEAT repeat protein
MGDEGFAVVLDALRDPNSNHYWAAKDALTGLRLRVVDRLRPLLEDPEAPEAVRRAAADVFWSIEAGRSLSWGALAGCKDTRARDALAARLGDPDPYVRSQARSALAGRSRRASDGTA